MTWRAARSLTRWHEQLKAKAPRAVKELPGSVWGLRAGASHAQSGGHFPHSVPGIGSEIVTAADAPNAPQLGLDIHAELDAIRRSRDPRVLYAISNDRMFSSYAAHGYPPYTWRPYNPTDPGRDKHIEHGHLQVVDDARADGTQPWATAGAATTGGNDMGVLEGDQARRLTNLDQFVFAIVNGDAVAHGVTSPGWTGSDRPVWLTSTLTTLAADAKASRLAIEALTTALNKGGGSVDSAKVIARMDELAAAEVAREQQLLSRIGELETELEQARHAQHAAAQAEADATADRP